MKEKAFGTTNLIWVACIEPGLPPAQEAVKGRHFWPTLPNARAAAGSLLPFSDARLLAFSCAEPDAKNLCPTLRLLAWQLSAQLQDFTFEDDGYETLLAPIKYLAGEGPFLPSWFRQC